MKQALSLIPLLALLGCTHLAVETRPPRGPTLQVGVDICSVVRLIPIVRDYTAICTEQVVPAQPYRVE